jgi:hypothetical protein
MNWFIGEVEDMNPPGREVPLYRDWVADLLEGVREPEEKLSRLRAVFDLRGQSRWGAGQGRS